MKAGLVWGRGIASAGRIGGATLVVAAMVFAGPLAARENLRITDVYQIAFASDPQISADASRVVYVAETADAKTDTRHSSLKLIDLKQGRESELTTGSRNDSLPRWSPDGKQLAYQAAGAEGFSLIVRNLADGTERTLRTSRMPLMALSWAPDGSRLAAVRQVFEKKTVVLKGPAGAERQPPARISDRLDFQGPSDGQNRPAHLEALVIDAAKPTVGDPAGIAFSQDAIPPRGAGVQWSRDGASLIVSANRATEFWRNIWQYTLYEIRIDTGAIRALTAPNGSDYGMSISPDGTKLAYISDQVRKAQWYFRQELTISDREGGNVRVLGADLDRPFSHVAWSGNKAVVASYVDRGAHKLGLFGLDGSRRILADTMGGRLTAYADEGGFSVAANGTVAFTQSKGDQPSEIAIAEPGKPVRVVSNLNTAFLAQRQLGSVQPISFKAADGMDIAGWVVRPPNFQKGKRYPMIVDVHGGVSSDFGPGFDLGYQTLAAHGFIVTYINYRGSGSYGEPFSNIVNRKFPIGVEADPVAAIDAMVAAGEADPDQVYLAGGSAGGTLTAWTVGHSDRFKAAAVLYPVIDWGTYYVTSISYMRPFLFDKPVWEDREDYARRSPLTFAGNVHTPTIVMVGDNDRITPPDQAVAFYSSLKMNGVDARLVTFPNEPHGLEVHPSHQAQVTVAMIDWFKAHGAQVESPRYGPEDVAPAAPAN
ncbi:S9 family peptidase [Novosphingobium sp.]|uniref:S9 family peptidase n=1 Tax=Novosphingobium sp. TaxID=1874826 RepID=UPI0026262F62|nr:S9 family peptidase [Novosphingobium sp.]